MLLKLFKTNHPIIFILVPIVAAALWLPELLLNPHEVILFDKGNQAPLYKAFILLLNGNYILIKSIAFILFIAEGLLLMRLNYKYIFIESKTYLPAILFVVIGSVFPYFQNLHPLLIANLFIILAFDRCFEISKDRNQFQKYFESGLLLGIGGLFYLPAFIFISIIWLTQVILRTFNWREWMASIIGFLSPILIYFTIIFLQDNHLPYFEYFTTFWTQDPSDIIVKGIAIYPLIGVGIIIAIAFLYDLSIVGARKISTRKYFALTLWLLAISFVSKLFLPFISTSVIYVFAIPASFVLTMFFVELRKKWIAETFFYFLILFVVAAIFLQLNIISQ